jgi:hypothetical protein
MFVLGLRAAAMDPSFQTVVNGARSGLDAAAWHHLLLQLEAGRACREMALSVSYEPAIEGSVSKGDLLIEGPGTPWLIETTAVLRGEADKTWEAYEELIKNRLRTIEHRHGVACVSVLIDHPVGAHGVNAVDPVTEDLLLAVELAAHQAGTTQTAQVVECAQGRIEIYPDGVPVGTTTFTGAIFERDGWTRLRRTLASKARQINGPLPAWVRIDCRDGLFQFGEWPRMAHAERIAIIAEALTGGVAWPTCAQGVVLSSGLAGAFSATDPVAEGFTVETDHGILMRRLVARYLLRESVIVPFGEAAWTVARQWRDAYGAEPRWLDTDLAAAGMPSLNDFWVAYPRVA